MKKLLALFIGISIFTACGVKVPYSEDIKNQYGLDEDKMRKVQFYTSSAIIMERTSSSGSSETASDGSLVSSSSKEQNRLIINPNTKCVFDKIEKDGSVLIRFEIGQNKALKFAIRPGSTGTAQKMYLVAIWERDKGGKIEYGNEEWTVTSDSGMAYLMVKIRRSQRTKKSDRVVKGMKV